MGAIVVAVDGTDASAGALARARELAAQEARPLTGVFVIDAGWADFIGNDWQSSRNARQGFLDYVLSDQERHSERARAQFAGACGSDPQACFRVLVGEPLDALAAFVERENAAALVMGREGFRACGRPSAKQLGKRLTQRLRQPVYLV
ncbi:MAG: hypothetical protein OHK0026_07910 [Rhodocyclaceae bacterium]